MNLTDEFVAYLMAKSAKQLPNLVQKQAEQCLVDYLGVTIAGHRMAQEQFKEYEQKCCGGPVRIIGGVGQTDGLTAAFLNGFSAHILELDDGHRFGMIHLAAPVLSAVLTAVQMRESVTWDQMILGTVMGYEAAVRLARGLQPEHKQRGYHTSGTCGTVGAAVGAAFALGCTEETLKRTISAAGTSAAGILEIQENASELKPYNVAHAAMSGWNAAFTGQLPFAVPEDILGGDRGMIPVMAGAPHWENILEQTPYYEIQRIYRKPYVSCRHCHSAVEGILGIQAEAGLDPDQIQEIHVETYQMAVQGHDHQTIQGIASAKLSIPYSVAVAAVTGDCGMQAFSEQMVKDANVLALAKRVQVQERAEFTRMAPGKRIAEVCVLDREGRKFTRRVEYAKGDPENPMSPHEIREKFTTLMAWAGEAERGEGILQGISSRSLSWLLNWL